MGDGFAHDVSRKLCLQLCSLAGYGAASDDALDVLADLVKTFVRETSLVARSYAENAGRTEANAKDIAMGLSETGHSVEELKEFERTCPEVPFGATVPKFPVAPATEAYTSFKSEGQRPPEHIPSYLPTFPAEHTFRETALYLNNHQDELEKAVRDHEVKKTTEDVLMKQDLAEKDGGHGDTYLSALLNGTEKQEEPPEAAVDRRQRKMAAKWSELLLGRLQQNEATADPTSRLATMTSLSSVSTLDPHEMPHHAKRRRKEREGKGGPREKKAKSAAAPTPFSAVLKFNLQPTANSDQAIKQELPDAVPTDVTAPLPVVKEEAPLEMDDLDVIGGVQEVEGKEAEETESAVKDTPPHETLSEHSRSAA